MTLKAQKNLDSKIQTDLVLFSGFSMSQICHWLSASFKNQNPPHKTYREPSLLVRESLSLIVQRLLWLQGKVLALASVPSQLLGLPLSGARLKRRQGKNTLCIKSVEDTILQRVLQLPRGLHTECDTLHVCYREMIEKINGGSEDPLLPYPQSGSSHWHRELPPQSNFVHMVQGENEKDNK